MSFLTVEDVNGCLYSNQGFWWHELDTAVIDPTGEAEFSNITVDFCTITKTSVSSDRAWEYTIIIDNPLWTTGVVTLDKDDVFIDEQIRVTDNTLKFTVMKSTNFAPCKFILYMGSLKLSSPRNFVNLLVDSELSLDLKELGLPQTLKYKDMNHNRIETITQNVVKGFNEIKNGGNPLGYLLVKLIKTDFQFQCNQSLTVGEVNTVHLGTLTDYKPDGAMIGTNTPTISVEYNDEVIPVVWDNSLNDYVFNIDLTSKQNEGNIRLKVNIEANQVINASETIISLPCSYEAINTVSKLVTLFKNGGIGRITSNIDLTNDLIVSKDVYLVAENKTLTMNSHKIVVPSNKTFKANNLTFTGGLNTIQQNINTKVELTGCTFSNCTGLGSVIDCQIDVNSLNNEDDFTTIINNCTFTNNDLCILHGGDLTITDCVVNGKISDKDYPYFLYQTDGRAVILQSQFNISSNSQITSDLEFNPCIFTCGETALINGHSHSELQNNNLTSFFETQRNTSSIDLTYKYSLIDDYIRLKSDKGFCHSVSGVDYVFKTNVTPERI